MFEVVVHLPDGTRQSFTADDVGSARGEFVAQRVPGRRVVLSHMGRVLMESRP